MRGYILIRHVSIVAQLLFCATCSSIDDLPYSRQFWFRRRSPPANYALPAACYPSLHITSLISAIIIVTKFKLRRLILLSQSFRRQQKEFHTFFLLIMPEYAFHYYQFQLSRFCAFYSFCAFSPPQQQQSFSFRLEVASSNIRSTYASLIDFSWGLFLAPMTWRFRFGHRVLFIHFMFPHRRADVIVFRSRARHRLSVIGTLYFSRRRISLWVEAMTMSHSLTQSIDAPRYGHGAVPSAHITDRCLGSPPNIRGTACKWGIGTGLRALARHRSITYMINFIAFHL